MSTGRDFFPVGGAWPGRSFGEMPFSRSKFLDVTSCWELDLEGKAVGRSRSSDLWFLWMTVVFTKRDGKRRLQLSLIHDSEWGFRSCLGFQGLLRP
ncbi:hypothetical protein AVEN_52317-1 [Araneus ventricosus]|uniref:Uncharacterized protein n=1 Tax=Araneus ventricosus TaxID=182803 RepID=A0A4Y2GHF9_ARAVE|nr:hypothetical protein AVEN_52317-1 [Araneus ventricosus]